MLTHWKEREPGFRARHDRILETLGEVPAYATAAQGGPVDVTPKQRAPPPRHRAGRRGGVASEFQEMVRDLGVEEQPESASPSRPPRARRPSARGRPPGAGAGRTARAAGRLGRRPKPPAAGDDGVAQGSQAAQPPSREAALMAMLVWVMVGLAVWHFTVLLPDDFYGGIVGAFVGAVIGSVIFGLDRQPRRVPGESGTDFITGVEGDPGAVLGLAVTWWLGKRELERTQAARLARGPDGPQPVARARQLGAQVALGRAEAGRLVEVAAGDPHAAGVVGGQPAADGRGRAAAGERA